MKKLFLIVEIITIIIQNGYSESKFGQTGYLPQYNLWLPGSKHFNSDYKSNDNIFSFDSLYLWQVVNTGTCCSREIYFLDSLHGWISYTGYTDAGLIKTTNSGFNWDSIQIFNNVQFQLGGNFFINYDTGWVVGALGLIRKTINGGFTWINQDWQDQEAYWYAVHFFNYDTGIIVGVVPFGGGPPHGLIIKTTNSGETWNSIYQSIDTTRIRRQFWLNEYTGWCSGDDILLKSIDGGNTFANYYSHIPPTGNRHNGINDVFFINNDTGWICGSNLDYKNIYKTINGGINWVFQDNPITQYIYPQINGIIFISPDIGWASSYVNLIIYTTNGGSNWNINKQTNEPIWEFSKYQNSKIWLRGDGETVWYLEPNGPIGISDYRKILPKEFRIYNNYPNPFNLSTKIKFDIYEKINLFIKIYDVDGKLVNDFVNREFLPGKYELLWTADNLSSGIYFCTFKFKNEFKTIKMLLLK